MTPTLLTTFLVVLAALATLVGAVDAAIGGEGDLFVVFVVALALQVVLLVRLNVGRPSVPLRIDLVRWLRERAAATGEPMDQIADRAVATYRAGLSEAHDEEAR